VESSLAAAVASQRIVELAANQIKCEIKYSTARLSGKHLTVIILQVYLFFYRGTRQTWRCQMKLPHRSESFKSSLVPGGNYVGHCAAQVGQLHALQRGGI
jgi:hypothetical protein